MCFLSLFRKKKPKPIPQTGTGDDMLIVNNLNGFGGKPQLAPVVAGVDGISGGTSITVPIPTGLQPNDIILVFFETAAGTTVATPSGFTLIYENDDLTSAVTQINSYWKRATGSETSFSQTATDHQCALVLLVRGCPLTGTPYEGATVSKTGSTTTPVLPTPTTTGTDRLVIQGIARGTDTGSSQFSSPTNSALESVTLLGEYATATGNGGGIAVVSGIDRIAGSSGTTSIGYSGSATNFATTVFAMLPA